MWAGDQAQTNPNTIMSNVAHISWLIHVLQMNFNVLLYIWEGGIEVELYLNGFFFVNVQMIIQRWFLQITTTKWWKEEEILTENFMGNRKISRVMMMIDY